MGLVEITTAAIMAATAFSSSGDHVVQPGDTLSEIAQDHGTSWQALHAANDHIEDPDLIYPGQRVTITGDELPSSGNSEKIESTPPSGGVWDKLAQCESSGDWQINTGNSFYGGLQFTLESWRLVGGTGMPHEASKGEQIARAERLLDLQGWGAWPTCSKKLGLR